MALNETEEQRQVRRAGDAATLAIQAGADPDAIRAAVEAGIREGYRIRDLQNGVIPESARTAPRAPLNVPPGSAIEALLKATGGIAA